MSQTVPPFADLLAQCQTSAVHLEMRDVYGVADEDADFAAWRAGHRHSLDNRAQWWNVFHDSVAKAVARGVVVRRARVVSEPVTEYIRYEHSCTFQNVMAGEQVRWLPRCLASDLLLPGNDLWLFDDRLIRFGLFSGDGAFVGHTLSDDLQLIKAVSDSFEAVWDRATPHDQYTI
ncbi:DUF6879 family protein [Actinacidiphila rubida]|uniref:DUF6879 domain-containing protein n=1 Tax=Actinacidiphila rubida TaxID=310780 RepID=A0A1H8L8N2_9ACTN|nr:DUF6879 family protein [Actinacidiphila rubida]SEO01156.1 hypothetical protein SAMN05216267_101581 [Actinacidiphila rubida]